MASRRIGDIVYEVARQLSTRQNRFWLEDRRNEEANPFYNQTESGLYLDFSYGLPLSVWIPWGEWGFIGGASLSEPMERQLVEGVMERLDTTLYRPEEYTKIGVFGPTYAVHKVEGVQLPEPVIRPRNAYLEYESAKKAWESFTEQYKQLKANDTGR